MPLGVQVGRAFDVTPAELVSGWILDSGVFSKEDLVRWYWWQG